MSSSREDDRVPQSDDEVTSSLMGLFAPPPSGPPQPPAVVEEGDDFDDRRPTVVSNNRAGRTQLHQDANDAAASLQSIFAAPPTHTHPHDTEATPLLSPPPVENDLATPKTTIGRRKQLDGGGSMRGSLPPVDALRPPEPFHPIHTIMPLPPIKEANKEELPVRKFPSVTDLVATCHGCAKAVIGEASKPSTWVGSFMFLLYHNVFCLTMGSAIIGPYRTVSMLGIFTKMAALGILAGAPVYWINLMGSSEIPALYPTVDLMTAPLLATIAIVVDETLHNDPNVGPDSDDIFLASFTILACIAVLGAGALLVLAGVFKLANLGSYLPFPVLAGFFAAVGVLTWTLAFKIDTQMSVGQVLLSGDASMIQYSLLHHAPSFIIASLMKYLGPKNPFFVISLVLASIGLFYVALFSLGVSIESAVEQKWFWAKSDLVYAPMNAKVGFKAWSPPAPFGVFHAIWEGNVHWGAVTAGLEPALALSFLYLIRCSIHGAALKKNVTTLHRSEAIPQVDEDANGHSHVRRLTSMMASKFSSVSGLMMSQVHNRKFSEVLDVEQLVLSPTNGEDADTNTRVVKPRPTKLALKDILQEYGICQIICGLVGSFGVVPSVAASSTMYLLGAESVGPQVGSCILLFFFYMTDFQMVSFIPKTAFSSLLVLGFLDMMDSWFIKSYYRTKEKAEWLVVPLIVILAFVLGLLQSVFVGLAMSTLIFVAAFFRSGVVKYIANGLSVRSTIERPPKSADWLDANGELIQILVLQNYLFFGNASSILAYISSMFDSPDQSIDPLFVPPMPKYVILDLTLVTGMDTSSVDVFSDIKALCENHECKLFLAGTSRDLMKTMSLSGFKADTAKERSRRQLRFFSDLDAAVGKTEDMLLQTEGFEEQISHPSFGGTRGFEHALEHIDEQHVLDFAKDLKGLTKYTKRVRLEAGQILYEDVQVDRGIFFVEHGIVKIERDADETLTRKGSSDTFSRSATNSWGSLNRLNARSSEVVQAIARMKYAVGNGNWQQPSFRVARVGPGWILGANEALSQSAAPGVTIAVSACELHFLSFATLKEVEAEDPVLVLSLYKLLACLMAKRQSITINQLATLRAIMSSPAQKHPHGRSGQSDHLTASAHANK